MTHFYTLVSILGSLFSEYKENTFFSDNLLCECKRYRMATLKDCYLTKRGQFKIISRANVFITSFISQHATFFGKFITAFYELLEVDFIV